MEHWKPQKVKVTTTIDKTIIGFYEGQIGEMVGASMEYDNNNDIVKTIIHILFPGSERPRMFFKDELEEV